MLSKGKTTFGLAVPQMFPDGKADTLLIQKHLRQAEALGYESLWVQDQPMGHMPTLDPLALMTYAVAHTLRIRIGVSVLVLPFRNPIHLAKITATIDQLSGGRFNLGIGIGGHRRRYPSFGITPENRVSRFEEEINLLKRLWTEKDVDYSSQFWTLEKVNVEPKPLQRPHPPIWFGGGVDAALKRAARLGDAWMGAGASSTSFFKQAIKKVRLYLEEEVRDPSKYILGKRVYIAVDRDKQAASKKLQEWFQQYYYDADLALKVSVFGPEEEVIDGLGRLMEEDPNMLMLNPVYDLLEQQERLAKDIIPRL